MDNDQKNEFVISDEDINHTRIDESKLDDNFDWKAEALRLDGLNARRATKLSKLKEHGAKKPPENTPPPQNNQPPKDDKFDYGQLAYLTAKGFDHADDQKYLKDLMKRTGSELNDLLSDEFVTGKLGEMKEKRTSQGAMPSGDDRNAPPAADQVEYWLNKGQLPPPDQVELRKKVVNAKIAREQGKSVFSSNPVVGGQ